MEEDGASIQILVNANKPVRSMKMRSWLRDLFWAMQRMICVSRKF